VIVSELAQQCRFDEALEVLDAIIARSSFRTDLPELHTVRARLLLKLGRYQEAEEESAHNRTSISHLVRATAIAQQGRYFDASAAILIAQNAGADRDLLVGVRAIAAMRSGDLAEAESLLVELLRGVFNVTSAIYNLACIRVAQGRLIEASGLIRVAWSLGWRNTPQLRSDPELELLRTSRLIDDLLRSPEVWCRTW
jgi:Flp pilus assembly protein TadD